MAGLAFRLENRRDVFRERDRLWLIGGERQARGQKQRCGGRGPQGPTKLPAAPLGVLLWGGGVRPRGLSVAAESRKSYQRAAPILGQYQQENRLESRMTWIRRVRVRPAPNRRRFRRFDEVGTGFRMYARRGSVPRTQLLEPLQRVERFALG